LVLALWGAAASGCHSKPAGAATAGSLEVLVTEARTGKPARGVRIELSTAAGREFPALTTPADGRVQWQAAAGGLLRVRCSDPLSRYLPSEVEVSSLAPLQVDLKPGVLATVAVRGQGGESLAGHVTVWTLGGEGAEHSASASSGIASLGPLSPGPAKMLVSAPGYRSAAVDLRIPASGGSLGEVRLEPGGTTIRGRLGPELRARTTEVLFRCGGAVVRGSLAGDGVFELTGLPESRGALVLRRRGSELYVLEVAAEGLEVDLGTIPRGSDPRREGD
jgi:hypothetical protein